MSASGKRHMAVSVPGFDGRYEVTNDGEIYSVTRMVKHNYGGIKVCRGRLMKIKVERNGYQRVSLSANGVVKSLSVHRIVCEAFHGQAPSAGMHVNHKNGVKSDNRSENLEWVTPSENAMHSFRVLGRAPTKSMTGKFGADHNRSIAVEAVSPLTGAMVCRYESMHEAARAGYSATKVCACVRGRERSHKGLYWRVASE